MAKSTISYLWRDPHAPRGFRTGVSLHSHTNQSTETLDFSGQFGNQYPVLRPFLSGMERRAEATHGIRINYAAAYWTPPMPPKAGLRSGTRTDREAGPGADGLHYRPRHHQCADAAADDSQRAADSDFSGVERPFGPQSFHLGVHNLPSTQATKWMATLAGFTAHPSEARLTEILAALNAEPNVLVVFNHPMWDLYLVGKEKHQFLLNEFLQKNSAFLHAVELNGLRHWAENRAARQLAEKWHMLLIAGGDRHGVEPNATINLTNATSFTEFVHEIRQEKKSDMLFMPQYAEPWKHRILQSAIDAVRNYPEFPQGSQNWDERVYHPDRNGVVRPLREVWPAGKAPWAMRAVIGAVQLMGRGLVSGGLRMAWSEAHQLRLALGEHDS